MNRLPRPFSLLIPLMLLVTIEGRAQRPELIVQTGSTGNLMSVAFSPDGRTLATGSWDVNAEPRVKLWDVATGLQLRTLEGSANQLSVVFGRDGRTLFTAGIAGSDDGIKVWDVATGKELRRFEGASPIALSPDGKTLASADGSTISDVRLWDVASGAPLRTLKGLHFQVNSIAFSPDGKTVAGGAQDNRAFSTAKLWNVETGATRHTLTVTVASGDVVSLAFSPDGKVLATGDSRTARLWNVATGSQLSVVAQDHCCANSLSFSPDGKILAIGHKDDTIALRDVESGRDLRTLKGIGPLVFAPDGKTLATGDQSAFEAKNAATIKLWDVASGTELRTLRGRPDNGVESVALSPDGRTVAAGLQGDNIKLRDIVTGAERLLKGYETDVNAMATPGAIAFSADGTKVAAGDSIHHVTIWDVASGRKLNNFVDDSPGSGECDDQGVSSLAFSPNGRTLAVGTDNALTLWNIATRARLRTFKKGCDDPSVAAFSPDGRTIAVVGPTSVQIRNVTTGSLLRSLTVATASSIVFSPNGKILALNNGESIKLLDAGTGSLVRSLDNRVRDISSIAFSPDGKIIAGATKDTVQLWDATTGRAMPGSPTKTTQSRPIEEIVFGKSGRYLIGASMEDVKVWDGTSGQELGDFISLNDRDWLAVAPDGLFDGSPAAWQQILWRFNNNTFDYAPVEAFFNEFFHPGLLADLLAGTRPRAASDISQKDRRQPRVNLTVSNAQPGANTRNIGVKIEISQAVAGAQDVRLFRNGSLVKLWAGDVLDGQSNVVLEATIPIVSGENRLTAYAFNHDNIKSSDATLVITGPESLKRQGAIYILAVGVDHYSNSAYDLKYAVADARDFSAEFKRQQELLKRYAVVSVTRLLDAEATKARIIEKLDELAARAQPEDAVIVYFAGHGTAHGDQFYLIPHDLGYDGPRENLQEAALQTILRHSISDRELEKSFEKLDAGQLLLVIDACNSGQALEAAEKRRGPMNSKGLAQLAYEKGMYVMTAAQSYQAAIEAARLGHGFLTYALIEEGLKQGAADREPKDRSIDLREWLNYASEQVPRMQQQNMLEALRGRGRYIPFAGDGRDPGLPKNELDARDRIQRPRVFYRRERETASLIVAAPGVASGK